MTHRACTQRETAVGVVVESPQRVLQLASHDSAAQLKRHLIKHRSCGCRLLFLCPLVAWRYRSTAHHGLRGANAVAWLRRQTHRAWTWNDVHHRRVRREVRPEGRDAHPNVSHHWRSRLFGILSTHLANTARGTMICVCFISSQCYHRWMYTYLEAGK